MRAGVRYVRHTPALQAVLVRRGRLHFVRECFVGAPASRCTTGTRAECRWLRRTSRLPRIGWCHRRFIPATSEAEDFDRLAGFGATLIFAAVTIVLGYVHIAVLVGGSLFLWRHCLDCAALNIQRRSANCNRCLGAGACARSLHACLLRRIRGRERDVGPGLRGRAGISLTLLIAAIGLVMGLTTGIRFKLRCGENLD